ncbi:MAG: hypothetical protein AB7O96_01805 [Pseudobdellovibrionaceae bacterium]
MKWFLASLFFIVIVFRVGDVFAIQNFPTYLTDDPDFQRRTLGPLCYSMDLLEENLPCNPAFLAREAESKFEINGALGQNVTQIQDLRAIFDGHVSEAALRDLFANHNELVVEGALKSTYKTRLWGVSITPWRAYSYSILRNSAYPILDVQAVQERSVNLAFASYMENDFSLGAQFRFLRREIINTQVAMFDLLAEEGRSLLDSAPQNAVYFEPGVFWKPEESPWSASFILTNLAYTSEPVVGYTSSPQGQLGGAWTSKLETGYVQAGLGTTLGEKPDVWEKHVRAGVVWGYGITEWAASASRISQSAGLMLRFANGKLGLNYNRNEIWIGDYKEAVFQNFLATFGFEL